MDTRPVPSPGPGADPRLAPFVDQISRAASAEDAGLAYLDVPAAVRAADADGELRIALAQALTRVVQAFVRSRRDAEDVVAAVGELGLGSSPPPPGSPLDAALGRLYDAVAAFARQALGYFHGYAWAKERAVVLLGALPDDWVIRRDPPLTTGPFRERLTEDRLENTWRGLVVALRVGSHRYWKTQAATLGQALAFVRDNPEFAARAATQEQLRDVLSALFADAYRRSAQELAWGPKNDLAVRAGRVAEAEAESRAAERVMRQAAAELPAGRLVAVDGVTATPAEHLARLDRAPAAQYVRLCQAITVHSSVDRAFMEAVDDLVDFVQRQPALFAQDDAAYSLATVLVPAFAKLAARSAKEPARGDYLRSLQEIAQILPTDRFDAWSHVEWMQQVARGLPPDITRFGADSWLAPGDELPLDEVARRLTATAALITLPHAQAGSRGQRDAVDVLFEATRSGADFEWEGASFKAAAAAALDALVGARRRSLRDADHAVERRIEALKRRRGD
jgi:hypothetical protein